jgi:hypothetical protein
MRLPFINREKEIKRINNALSGQDISFIVIYGRRRCGKSRLLQHVCREQDVYFLADQNAKQLQIMNLSHEIARNMNGFNQVIYPSWESLLNALNDRGNREMCLILDEFPYLVQSSPELPSVIQKQIDMQTLNIHLIICGSSQRMMQGIVMDSSAPLYGRADEIIKIQPMSIHWLAQSLELKPLKAIEHYSVWGGVPRYWELAKKYASLKDAQKDLIYDKNGILHNEPITLLLDNMRTTTQAHSLLAVIGNGNQRLANISRQMGTSANNLSRPLANLIDLDYIRRELPYGESIRSTKRSLYKLADPFLMFWYKFIFPNQSLLELDMIDDVYENCQKNFSDHAAGIWEELARQSTIDLKIDTIKWKPGNRWWGTGIDGKQMEIDIIADDLDHKHILIGEVKWEANSDIHRIGNRLKYVSQNFPNKKNKKIVLACWLKSKPKNKSWIKNIITPEQIVKTF